MMNYYLYIILFLVCLACSAFFSGSEVAFFSTTRAKVRTLLNEKAEGSESLSALKKNPDRFLITILIGNTIANILGASLATVVAISIFGETGLAITITTIVVVILFLIFGEIGPKMYGSRHSFYVALHTAPTILLFSKLLSPFIYFFNKVTDRMTNGSPFSHHMITEEEIKEWIDVGQEEGTIEKNEQEMLHSVFEFGDTRVREAMTPRVDVVMIEDTSTPQEALEVFKSTGYSRIPVFHDNTDTIKGVLNIKDAFGAVLEERLHEQILTLCSEPLFVPETKKIDDLLMELKIKKTHMAIVLDEYGSVVGIITVEDILEELVGEIFDEFDTEEDEILEVTKGIFSVDARIWIEDLNKELSLNLPISETYETIAGLFIDELGHIPRMGDVCELPEYGVKLIVIHMVGKRITRIKLFVTDPSGSDDRGGR